MHVHVALGAALVLLAGCTDETISADLLRRSGPTTRPPGSMEPPPPLDVADAGSEAPPSPPAQPPPSAEPDAGPPATPPPTTPPPTTPPATDDHQYCVDVVNRYRAMIGRPPLARATDLEDFANEGAREDTASGQPHGHFINSSGGGAYAENEVPSWPGDASSVRNVIDEGTDLMWSEGPGGGHYENIIGDYSEVACGIYVGGGVVTIVQDFR